MRKHIFNAGPAVLPEEILKQASESVLELDDSGVSILEISHRGNAFTEIIDEAQAIIKELLGIPDGYSILFLQGGASMQFCMIPYNLLGSNQTAGYVETGIWAKKAIKEAKIFGNINVLASSGDKNYNYIPKDYNIPDDTAYLHITSNNTIFGTQLHEYPNTNVPLVTDMSSDILSRPIDISQHVLIYAGTQKNLGPAGTTLIIIRNEIVGKVEREIPTLLNYQTHIDNNSLFNTPSVFSIYASLLTLRWIKSKGGLTEIEKVNRSKADKLYEEIDNNPLFKGATEKDDRSIMNVTFVMKNPELEDDFINAATEADIIGIKGHRSVGGFRASLYNALPTESVDVLIDVMRQFATKHG